MDYPAWVNPQGQGRGEEEWGMTANGYGISLWDDANVLELKSGDVCTTL